MQKNSLYGKTNNLAIARENELQVCSLCCSTVLVCPNSVIFMSFEKVYVTSN